MTIADHVRDDLIAHICSGRELTFKLTIEGISHHYDVSTTPVRTALEQLIEGDWVRKMGNGRLAVNPERVAKLNNNIPSHPKIVDWDRVITHDILLQSLSGRHGYLREEAAAAKYGVGRTVLRRIFSKMAGQGMLVHEPRRGWRVRVFSEKLLNDYLDMRVLLETRAMQLSRPRIDINEIKRIRTGNIPGSGDHSARLDNTLHRYWIDRCDNYFIRDFFDRHGPYFSTLFDHAAPHASVTNNMVEQHHAILDAIIADDWPAAEKALADHIRSQRPALAKMIDRLSGNDKSDHALEIEPLAV